MGRDARHYQPDVVLLGYVVQDARRAAYPKSQRFCRVTRLKDNVHGRAVYLALRSVLGDFQVKAKERPQNGEGGVYRVPPSDYVDNLRTLVESADSIGATLLFGFPLERGGYTDGHRKI